MSSSPLMFSGDFGSSGSSDVFAPRSGLGLYSFSDSGSSLAGNQNSFERRLFPPDNGLQSRPQDTSNMFSASAMRLGPQNSGGFSSGSQYDHGLTIQNNNLREENTKLRHEIELVIQQARTWKLAFEKISGDLAEKVDTATSKLEIISESLTTHGNPATSLSNTSTASTASLFALLSKSNLLPRLDPDNYQGIGHWYPGTYRKLRRTSKSSKAEDEDAEDELLVLATGPLDLEQASVTRKKEPVLSRFLEDKHGNALPEGQKKAILATAASFWQYLLDRDRAPKTFRKINIEVKLQWQVLMESNFECLRYCDCHWKVDQIWINYYPSWLKTARRKLAEENREKEGKNGEAEDDVIDIDADDVDELDADENDEEDSGEGEDEDTGEPDRGNKRGPTDNGRTDRSKRPRVEEPETPAARQARPQPTRISANRPRTNPLAHIRATPAIALTAASSNAPGTSSNAAPPLPVPVPASSGTSSGALEPPPSCLNPGLSSGNSASGPTSLAAPAPGPVSSAPSVPPPVTSSPGTSSGSLGSSPGSLVPRPSSCGSASNSTSQVSPASGLVSSTPSAPPPAPSQNDTEHDSIVPATSTAVLADNPAPQNMPLSIPATSVAVLSETPATSGPTPAATSTNTAGPQDISNTGSTSSSSTNSRKKTTKKDPKPKKMVPSKKLYYDDWKKEHPNGLDEAFEVDWKQLGASIKRKYTAQAKKLVANSTEGTST